MSGDKAFTDHVLFKRLATTTFTPPCDKNKEVQGFRQATTAQAREEIDFLFSRSRREFKSSLGDLTLIN